jgi:hypothetical protein
MVTVTQDGAASLVLASRRIAIRQAIGTLAARVVTLPEEQRAIAAEAIEVGGDVLDNPDATALDWAEAEFVVGHAMRATEAK